MIKRASITFGICLIAVFGLFTAIRPASQPVQQNVCERSMVQAVKPSTLRAVVPVSVMEEVEGEVFMLKDEAVALAGIRSQVSDVSENNDVPDTAALAEPTQEVVVPEETSLPEPEPEASVELVFNGTDVDWNSVPYDSDLYWLAKLINGEAEGEPYEGKIAVGNVVMNRVNNPRWPDTVKDVIFQKNQFSVVGGRLNLDPNQDSINAAYAVLNGEVYPGLEANVLYFNNFGRWWDGVTLWKQIGHHYFAQQQ